MLAVEIIFAIIMDFGNLNIITNILTNTSADSHAHTHTSRLPLAHWQTIFLSSRCQGIYTHIYYILLYIFAYADNAETDELIMNCVVCVV